MTIQILEVNENDLDSIITIENELFTSPYKKEDYLYELNDNPFSIFLKMVDKDSNELLGYIDFWITFEKAQIAKIAINKKYQGLKLSKLLMADSESRMKLAGCVDCTLEVRVSNEKAINLYKSFGYKQIAIRKKYYSNGEDAFLMIKEF